MTVVNEAFALNRYRTFKSGPIAKDLASLVVESSNCEPLSLRVNPFYLKIIGDKVVNPDLGEGDVSNYYNLDTKEGRAGLKIREVLLHESDGTISVWISPPGGEENYFEGRIVVGINRGDNMESYGICTKFNPKECLEIARNLGLEIEDPEKLREDVIIIKDELNPWDYLRKKIPLDEVWDSIASGEVYIHKQEVIKYATIVTNILEPFLKYMVGKWEQIVVGAWLEKLMMSFGYKIMGGVCGILNSEILGKVASLSGEIVKFVKNCGQCGIYIGKLIGKGYRCQKCGGEYAGC